MNNWLIRNRFLIARRIVQIILLVLFAGSNWFGWKLLMGNYSAAFVLESFYLADPHSTIQMLAAGFLAATDLLVGAFIVFLFYALIGGRGFCSWVCPVNIVTDLANNLRKKLKFGENENDSFPKRNTRYWVLVLGLVLSAILGVAAFEFINPVTMLHRGIIFGFGLGWLVIVAVFLFDFGIKSHGWCGYLCPLGAFYSVIGRYSLIKVNHIKENCTNCLKCKDVCPEVQVLKNIAIESGRINSGECTNCGKCIEVCNDNSLKYSINNYKK
jgi:ferredoxin-type protein NapH